VTLDLSTGALVDMVVEYTLNDGQAVISGPTIASGTLGRISHFSPDANLTVLGDINTIAA
jgi:hypothetical protein